MCNRICKIDLTINTTVVNISVLAYGSQVDEISHFKIVEAISFLQEAKSILI